MFNYKIYYKGKHIADTGPSDKLITDIINDYITNGFNRGELEVVDETIYYIRDNDTREVIQGTKRKLELLNSEGLFAYKKNNYELIGSTFKDNFKFYKLDYEALMLEAYTKLSNKDLYFLPIDEAINKLKKIMNGWKDLKVKSYIYSLQNGKLYKNISYKKHNPKDVFNLFGRVRDLAETESGIYPNDELVSESIHEAQLYYLERGVGSENDIKQKAVRIIYRKLVNQKKVTNMDKSNYKGETILDLYTLSGIFAVKFLTKTKDILESDKFKDVTSIVMDTIKKSKVYNLEKLLNVPIDGERTIGKLINDINQDIIISEVRRVDSIGEEENDKLNIIYDSYKEQSKHMSMMIYLVPPKRDEKIVEKSKKFANQLLEHIVKYRPLTVGKDQICKDILEKEIKSTKFLEFLDKACLNRQHLDTGESILDKLNEYKMGIIDFNYIAA